MVNKPLLEAYIQALINTDAIQIRSIHQEPFILRSGKKSYVYINHAKIASSAVAYKALIDAVKSLLQEVFNDKEFILCNVDSKISAQMVGSLAYILNKPQIIFKSKELTAVEKGIKEQLTGDATWNLPVAIVDDVMTGGDGTATNVGKLIKGHFLHIGQIHVFTGLIRNKNFQKNSNNIKLHSVLSYNEIITTLWNTLSDEYRKALEKEKSLSKA